MPRIKFSVRGSEITRSPPGQNFVEFVCALHALTLYADAVRFDGIQLIHLKMFLM